MALEKIEKRKRKENKRVVGRGMQRGEGSSEERTEEMEKERGDQGRIIGRGKECI